MVKICIELLLAIISISLSVLQKIEWHDSLIIAMLSFIVVEMISQNVRSKSLKKEVKQSISDVAIELKIIKNNSQLKYVKDELDFKIKNIPHPYFSNIFLSKLGGFIHRNSSLLNGEHSTSPLKNETYGAPGLLQYTDKSLKCVSSFEDYWTDKKDSDYYSVQCDLVKKGVTIQRLFVISESNKNIVKKECKKQKNIGIQVRIIEKHKLSNDDNFFRDYLIQDEILLVDLIPKDLKKLIHHDAQEVITVNGVNKRLNEFDQHWSRAVEVK